MSIYILEVEMKNRIILIAVIVVIVVALIIAAQHLNLVGYIKQIHGLK